MKSGEGRDLGETRISLIQCYCGSSTPDGLYNLECESCKYFVHGACYKKEVGPIVCAPCSLQYNKSCSYPGILSVHPLSGSTRDTEELKYQGLQARLLLALSQGEHTRFFGSNGTLSVLYLKVKFNLDDLVAKKLMQIVCEQGIFQDGSSGELTVDYNIVNQLKDEFMGSGSSEISFSGDLSCSEDEDKNEDEGERRDEDGNSILLLRVPETVKEEENVESDPSKKDGEEHENKYEELEKYYQMEIKMETNDDVLQMSEAKLEHLAKKGGRPRVEGPFHCEECDYVNLTKANLKKHIQSVHEKVRYPCPQCDHCSTKKDHLKQHIMSKHEGVRYNCDICEFSSPDPSTLRKHKIHKHEGKKYYCDQCDFIAARQGVLNIHMKSKHEGVTFMCDQCPYTANCKSRLQHHKNSKHENIRYPCDQCDYKAQKNSDLNQHKKRVHEKVRFFCDLCEYSACTAYILKVHKESKHDGKMYPCKICNYSSQYNYKTKHHELTAHEGFRYSCTSCNYQATSSSNIIRHKKKVHRE